MDSLRRPIRFRLNVEKAVEAIAWLAREQPGIDFFHLVKVIYFADKAHLSRYGRPILGDAYVRMQHGPVPSGVYDLLKQSDFLPADVIQAIKEAIEVKHVPHPSVSAVREANLDLFSRTDLECLQQALSYYGSMSVGELWEVAHSERAWIEAPPNGEMDYLLMIDDDISRRDRLIEELDENAANFVF